jgi:hypothetical protein
MIIIYWLLDQYIIRSIYKYILVMVSNYY